MDDQEMRELCQRVKDMPTPDVYSMQGVHAQVISGKGDSSMPISPGMPTNESSGMDTSREYTMDELNSLSSSVTESTDLSNSYSNSYQPENSYDNDYSYSGPDRKRVIVSESDIKGNYYREKIGSEQISIPIPELKKRLGDKVDKAIRALNEQVERRLTLVKPYDEVIEDIKFTATLVPSKFVVLLKANKSVRLEGNAQYYEGYIGIQLVPNTIFRAGGEGGDI